MGKGSKMMAIISASLLTSRHVEPEIIWFGTASWAWDLFPAEGCGKERILQKKPNQYGLRL